MISWICLSCNIKLKTNSKGGLEKYRLSGLELFKKFFDKLKYRSVRGMKNSKIDSLFYKVENSSTEN